MLNRTRIDTLICMTEREWERHHRVLIAAEAQAYSRYGFLPIGSGLVAGLGTEVCRGVGQQEWFAARDRLRDSETIRLSADYWSRSGEWYQGRDGHDIWVDSHGVDLSDCPTPARAIAKVRAVSERTDG